MTKSQSLQTIRNHVTALQDQLAEISLTMSDLNIERLKTKERLAQALQVLEIAECDGVDAALLYKLSN